MKLLSSLLIAAYAQTVDEKQCHKIGNNLDSYRKFFDKKADLDATHNSLERINSIETGNDSNGVPNCLAECDQDNKCLFVLENNDGSCDLIKLKAGQSEVLYKPPFIWTESDDLIDEAGTDIYIKCHERPCGVEYFKDHKWTDFHGKPKNRVGTPLADGTTHKDGSPATTADCPRICADKDDCTAFYHNVKTGECELFTQNENWAKTKWGINFDFENVDGGFTLAKCEGRCLTNWGPDTNDCFPERVQHECQSNGLKFNAQLSDIYENHLLLTDAQKVSEIKIGDNNIVGGSFDENGRIEIIKTWEELGVEAVYNQGDVDAGHIPTITYSALIKPENPNIAISKNGPEIFLARTDDFEIKCVYPAQFTIDTQYTTLTEEIGETGNEIITNPMIGEFDLKSFSDTDHTAEITPDAPINLGEMIYNKMTVSNLPTGLDYFVDACEVDNIANQNWETDGELLILFADQICKNNDMKSVLGINIHGKDDKSYSFDFLSFSFQSNLAEINSQGLVCSIKICGKIGQDDIACKTPPTQDSECKTGFSL